MHWERHEIGKIQVTRLNHEKQPLSYSLKFEPEERRISGILFAAIKVSDSSWNNSKRIVYGILTILIEFVLPEPGCQPVTTTAIPPELHHRCYHKMLCSCIMWNHNVMRKSIIQIKWWIKRRFLMTLQKMWQNLYDCGVIHDSKQVSQIPVGLSTGPLQLL